MLSRIRWLPSSLSDSLTEFLAPSDQMKCTYTLTEIMDFSGFEHIWKQQGIQQI